MSAQPGTEAWAIAQTFIDLAPCLLGAFALLVIFHSIRKAL